MITYRSNKAIAAASLLHSPKPKTFDEYYTFEKTFEKVYFWSTFIPSNNTFKELSSSGNLNLISSDSIKYYLLELDKMYETISIHEDHMRREYEQYFYDIAIPNTDILNFFDFENITDEGRLKILDTTNVTKEQIEIMLFESQWLLENKPFRNGLKLATLNNYGLKTTHLEMHDFLKRMNDLIIQDLQKK